MPVAISNPRKLPIDTRCFRDLHAVESSRCRPCNQRLIGLASLPHQSGDCFALQLDGSFDGLRILALQQGPREP